MATHADVSPAPVQRIWAAHGLQPHRVRQFKLSRDPQFVEKLTDVIGLYLNPPDKAPVPCVRFPRKVTDSASRSHTTGACPMTKGRCEPDDPRLRTFPARATLFAALNVLDGSVIVACLPRRSTSGIPQVSSTPGSEKYPAS